MKCRNIGEKVLNIDMGNIIVNFTIDELNFIKQNGDNYEKVCRHLRSLYFNTKRENITSIIKIFKENNPNNTMYFKINEYMETQFKILGNTYHLDVYPLLVHTSPTIDIRLGTMTWLSELQKQYDVNMLYVLEFIGENGVETTIKYKAIII